MNRRESLKALTLIAAGSGILAGACRQETPSENTDTADEGQLPGVQDFEHERNKQLYAEKFFTDHEMATITVLADIIIPKDDTSGSASDAGVPDFIEFMVKDLPNHKIPMRGGLKWLDIQSEKRYGTVFIKAKESQQFALLDDIAYPENVKPGMEPGAAFFSLMRDLTASGFFTSEMGVEDIGYAGNRPGVWKGVPEDLLQEHGFDPDRFLG